MYNNYDRCEICGARLSENNSTGIGFGCLNNVVYPARSDMYREFCYLNVWIKKAKNIQSLFIETFKDTKFRSEFNKSFYQSMSVAERISKKQLDIMIVKLNCHGIFPILSIDKQEKEMLIEEAIRNNPEAYKEALNKHKKLYLSGKKNNKQTIEA